MIQLIATDMDGTVLGPDHTISKRNTEAIKKAQAQGIEVLIATGRGFTEAKDPVSKTELDLSYICLNGAETRDRDENVISSIFLAENDIKQSKEILERNNIPFQLFVEDRIYTLDAEEQVNIFIQLAESSNQVPLIDEIRKDINKRVEEGYIRVIDSFDTLLETKIHYVYKIFASSFNRDDLDRARAELQDIQGIAVSSSGAGNIEITNINAQKGIALEQHAKRKGIAMENVMVIGDSFNDLSMMERAGRSVAMENAPDEIKAACTHVTKTNSDDGVAHAIEAILKA